VAELRGRDHETPCKGCAATGTLFGVVDFSKNCEERHGRFLPLTGIPVYYYRCPECGLIYSCDFDALSDQELSRLVYNEDYAQVDPDFGEARPRASTAMVSRFFGAYREDLSILDYGCGNGRLVQMLASAGFRQVEGYDPFVERYSARPTGTYDLVLCFEVLEHAVDPRRTFADLAGFRKADGIVLYSTLLQPPDIAAQKLAWWYAGPRNGHFTLHSAESLRRGWKVHGLRTASMKVSLHVAFSRVPEFARHLIRSP
jgi:2-polyprenyl-6-hydroxyphenyl methylase/3-demethylubiquinone-9 3-methyltransferase